MALTLKTAKALAATVGASIRKRDGEYRVAFAETNYADTTAYFTNDLADAVATAFLVAGKPVPTC